MQYVNDAQRYAVSPRIYGDSNHLYRSDCDNGNHAKATCKNTHRFLSADQQFVHIKDNDCVVNKYCGCHTVNLFSRCFFFVFFRNAASIASHMDPYSIPFYLHLCDFFFIGVRMWRITSKRFAWYLFLLFKTVHRMNVIELERVVEIVLRTSSIRNESIDKRIRRKRN